MELVAPSYWPLRRLQLKVGLTQVQRSISLPLPSPGEVWLAHSFPRWGVLAPLEPSFGQ